MKGTPKKGLLACMSFCAVVLMIPGFASAATSTEGITFAKDVLPILSRNCLGCHPGIPLTTYHEVRPWAKAIDYLVQSDRRYVEHTNIGTPPSPLGEDEVQTIHRWIRFRAPRTVPNGLVGVSYTEDIQPILEESCLRCHSRRPISMYLAEYQDVRPWAKAVRRLAQSEELYVGHTSRGRLSDFLTDSEVETINAWVVAGAPEGVEPEADTVTASATSETYVESDQFAFALPDFDGRMVSLDDPRFRNKVVLVDLWGTWCLSCVTAIPHLINLYNKYRPAGLEVIGIAYEMHDTADARHEAVAAFRREFGIPYTLLDGGPIENGIQLTLPALKNFEGYPTMIIIGRDGGVKTIEVGFLPGAEGQLEQIIVDLLGERRDR